MLNWIEMWRFWWGFKMLSGAVREVTTSDREQHVWDCYLVETNRRFQTHVFSTLQKSLFHDVHIAIMIHGNAHGL